VLDLVPLARSRRQVADGDLQSGLVGELFNSSFQRRTLAPLLPISSFPALGWAAAPIDSHPRRILWGAKAAVSWSVFPR
jgi:hypothetical protein